MSAPIHRTIPEGARDQQRARGDTTLGDIVVVRELDKSSTPLQAAWGSIVAEHVPVFAARSAVNSEGGR